MGEEGTREIGYVPEVTMVHPRADGELPASICESSAWAAGSAIGPPSMTASSKRKIAALNFWKIYQEMAMGKRAYE